MGDLSQPIIDAFEENLPFWVEFVGLGPPGVQETKLRVESIHVPHVEKVICVADTKIPDLSLKYL